MTYPRWLISRNRGRRKKEGTSRNGMWGIVTLPTIKSLSLVLRLGFFSLVPGSRATVYIKTYIYNKIKFDVNTKIGFHVMPENMLCYICIYIYKMSIFNVLLKKHMEKKKTI